MCRAIWFVLLVTFTDCRAQVEGSFKSYYETNFNELKSSFHSHQLLSEFFDKQYLEKEYLDIDIDIVISGFQTKNLKNQVDDSQFLKYKIYPLFYAKTKGVIVLAFNKIIEGEYGEKEYQCWLKSFTEKGLKKDSILISHLADYEGRRIRVFSDFSNDLQNINLKYFEMKQEEDGRGEIVTDTIAISTTFKLNEDGAFIVQKNNYPFIFKTDYGYSSLDKILKEYSKNCLYPFNTKLDDLNNDGFRDLVILLKRKSNNCTKEEFNLIIAISNNQGLYVFKGAQGGIDLNPNQFIIDNLLIDESNLISFTITMKNSEKFVKMYYSFDMVKKLCFFSKMDFTNSGSKETILAERPNMHVAQSIKLAKSILQK